MNVHHHLTVLEVTADWCDLPVIISQHVMRLSVAHSNGWLDLSYNVKIYRCCIASKGGLHERSVNRLVS